MSADLRGLIVDWGGVLTAPLDEAVDRWAQSEGIDLETYSTVMKGLVAEANSPIHRLERGEIGPVDFEQVLAVRFEAQGLQIRSEGILARMLEGLQALSEDMVGLLRRARGAGLRTALLSNSWGEHYPEHLWIGAFDQVVISGRVGMRKPEPQIYRHTAELLELPPQQCVFVDDLRPNVVAAADVGMVGVHFSTYPDTVDELEILFGLDLR
ncbi:HAD family hydrolase [Kineosporia succinea]|uniref:Epoxide hydrolase-like predicted phosphatase n=1 Tax=Kineosporia succinea TaxID=84632 RepID=A0ABT9NY65_9ACTN|nr:HAD family phosphatase [Kineosporia succinea]MDP9825371.1 epoxide hydrolase-like predicted phosphatase [Kineosporia succinea]